MRPRLSDVYRLSEVWLFKILNLAEDFFAVSTKGSDVKDSSMIMPHAPFQKYRRLQPTW